MTAYLSEWLDSSEGRVEDIFALWVAAKRNSRWVAERLIDEGHLDRLIDAARLQGDPGLREALIAVRDAHDREPDGGMGWTAKGEYVRKPDVCQVCGTPDEYGVDWPCWTRQTADAALAAPPPELGLDVERLARAMAWEQEHSPGGRRREWSDLQRGVQIGWIEAAERIAARLSESAEQETPR